MSAKINDGMTRSQRYYHRHKEQRAAYSKQYNKKKSLERQREREQIQPKA